MPPDATFLPTLRSFCDEHGALLVCDEIETCMGRTGKWFAFEHQDTMPDVIVMGRGIAGGFPLGAVLVREELAARLDATAAQTFRSNPVCCAGRSQLPSKSSSADSSTRRVGAGPACGT